MRKDTRFFVRTFSPFTVFSSKKKFFQYLCFFKDIPNLFYLKFLGESIPIKIFLEIFFKTLLARVFFGKDNPDSVSEIYLRSSTIGISTKKVRPSSFESILAPISQN